MLVSVASSFFLMPFVIHSLGDRWYGLWILIGSFVGVYGLLDFGISNATQRYLAHAMPRKDPEELNTIVASSLALFSGVGLVALLVTAGVVALAPLFMSDPHDIVIFREVALIMGGGFALSFPFFTQFGILTANLRFDYASYIQIGKILLRTGLFFLVLGLGYGIVVLAITSVAIDFVGYVALVLLARRLAPWLKLGCRHFTLAKMRELMGFGIYPFLGKVGNTVKFRMSNVIIASALGLGAVTHYNIAAKLNGYFFDLISRFVPDMTAVYTRYYSRGEHQQIRDKFLILSRLNVIIGMLGIGAVVIFARPFITLWVGAKYLDAFVPLIILLAGRIPALAVKPGRGIGQAMARHRFPAVVSVVGASVSILLSLLLVQWYGLVGVALGLAIPMATTRAIITPLFLCHIMNLRLARFLKNILPVMLVAASVHVPLWYVTTRVEIDAYWEIMAWAAGYYTPWLVFFYTVMLTPEARQLFMEALPWFPGALSRGRKAARVEENPP